MSEWEQLEAMSIELSEGARAVLLGFIRRNHQRAIAEWHNLPQYGELLTFWEQLEITIERDEQEELSGER